MFDDLIVDFHESLDGLRDFISTIDPFLDEYQEKVSKKHKLAFKPLQLARQRFLAKTEDDRKKYDEELKTVFKGNIEVAEMQGTPFDELEKTDEIEQDIKDENQPTSGQRLKYSINGDTSAIDEAFKDFMRSDLHKQQLYRSSLISLMSSVEWFFSQLLHFQYDKYPDSAGVKNKTISLNDLKSFSSVQDAERFLVENKIEEILRGSFKDWTKLLKDEFGLGLGYYQNFEEDVIEIYQRRNILVHNGGKINSIYLSKVAEKFRTRKAIGNKLKVDRDYLDKAINILELLFTLIAFELWKKQGDKNEHRGIILMEWGYEKLKRGEWKVAECINTFLLNDKKVLSALKTTAQLNVWLCRKEVGETEGVKKEIAGIDYTDKSLKFQIALAALREDKESFFELLPQALEAKEVEPDQLLEFPILRVMRECPEFEDFKETNGILKQYLMELRKEDDKAVLEIEIKG